MKRLILICLILFSFNSFAENFTTVVGQGKYIWVIGKYKKMAAYSVTTKIAINCFTKNPFQKLWLTEKKLALGSVSTKVGFVIKVLYNPNNKILIYGASTDGQIIRITQNNNPPAEWTSQSYTQVNW